MVARPQRLLEEVFAFLHALESSGPPFETNHSLNAAIPFGKPANHCTFRLLECYAFFIDPDSRFRKGCQHASRLGGPGYTLQRPLVYEAYTVKPT